MQFAVVGSDGNGCPDSYRDHCRCTILWGFYSELAEGFFAQVKEGTYLSFLVEILTAQLVIYVNIDDDIKNHFTHAEKNI